MKNTMIYIFSIFCIINISNAQSKNAQIEKLNMELDSSQNQQIKLIDQIYELNKIAISNQVSYEKHIIILETQIEEIKSENNTLKLRNDSLQKYINSLSVELIDQKTYDYSDKVLDYKVFIDRMDEFDCFIKSITIFNHLDQKVIQTIYPPENSYNCDSPKDVVFSLVDMNFDGFIDFNIIAQIPAGPNIPLYCWVFDINTQKFQRETTLEDITSPEFDFEKKEISSFWRDGCCTHGLRTYKYINGKVTLIEEIEDAYDSDSGNQVSTTKKLINGKMKEVERKIEKITNHGN